MNTVKKSTKITTHIKGARSAYNFFIMENRKAAVEMFNEQNGCRNKNIKLSKFISQLWKSLKNDNIDEWNRLQQLAIDDKVRYDKDNKNPKKLLNTGKDNKKPKKVKKPHNPGEDDKPIIDKYGSQTWNREGKLHRDGDLPAHISINGIRTWFRKGKVHRDHDLPAMIDADGVQMWYKDGKQHRDHDRPAYIGVNGVQMWYKDGKQYCI